MPALDPAPQVGEPIENVRASRRDERIGLAQGHLHVGLVRERRLRPHVGLRGDEGLELVDRVTGDAERHRGDERAVHRERRQAEQRAVAGRLVLEPHRAFVWHEGIANRVVVARRPTQTGRVPGVDHLDVLSRRKDFPEQGSAKWRDHGFTVARHPAPRDEPLGMARTTCERPPSRHAVPAVDLLGRAFGPKRARRDRPGIAEDLVSPRGRQVSREGRKAAGDHHAPSDRAIDVRSCLDGSHERHRIDLTPSEIA